MGDSFIPDSFEPDQSRGFVAGAKATVKGTIDSLKVLGTPPDLATGAGMWDVLTGPGGRLIRGMAEHAVEKVKEAYQAGKEGKPLDAVIAAVEATPAGAMVEPVIERGRSGDWSGAAGAAAVLAAPALLAKGVPSVARGAAAVGRAGRVIAADPALAADVVGVVSPRAAHAASLARRGMSIADRLRQAVARTREAPKALAGRMEPAAQNTAVSPIALVSRGEPVPVSPGGPISDTATLAGPTWGRTGGIPIGAGQQASGAEAALLEDLAQAQLGKSFAKANPAERQIMRNLAERIKATEQAPATTPRAGPQKPPGEAPATAPPKTTPPGPQEPVTTPAAPRLPAEEAYARPAPGAETKPHYEQAARTVKARALARFLSAARITPEDAARMGPKQWEMAAKGAGVNAPSPKSAMQAIEELKKLPPGSVGVEEFMQSLEPAP